jgi:hypothetical protein
MTGCCFVQFLPAAGWLYFVEQQSGTASCADQPFCHFERSGKFIALFCLNRNFSRIICF